MKKGVDIELRDPVGGSTPLLLAAAHGDAKTVQVLLNAGADVRATADGGDSVMHSVINNRQHMLPIVDVLLAHGANIDTHGSLGQTPLMKAVYDDGSGWRDVRVKILLEAGADVHRADNEGATALERALRHRYTASLPALVTMLIERGADVNVRTIHGRTPLMTAAFRCPDVAPVQMLLNAGADLAARDNYGNLALHWAVHFGVAGPNRHTIELLFEKTPVNVDMANHAGWTPLMEASRTPHNDVFLYLVQGRIDVNAQNSDGWTAMMVAAAANRPEVWLRWFRRERWFFTHTKPPTDEELAFYAGMFAKEYWQVPKIWAMLSAGADAGIKGKDGSTVRSLLQGRDDPQADVIRALLDMNIPDLVRRHKAAEEERRQRR